jgi:hypothetical protein
MERHNRQIPSHDARAAVRGRLARRLTLGLSTLVLVAGLSGCGSEASTDSAIVVGAADATWSLPDDYGDGINSIAPVMPIMIQVLKGSTPVPGVEITIIAGGINIANPTILEPITGNVLDDGTGLLQTHTDDHGVIVVVPAANVTGCITPPAAKTTVSGNLSLGIFISADSANWNGAFTYSCNP